MRGEEEMLRQIAILEDQLKQMRAAYKRLQVAHTALHDNVEKKRLRMNLV